MSLMRTNLLIGKSITTLLYRLAEFLLPTDAEKDISRWSRAKYVANNFSEEYYGEYWSIKKSSIIPHSMKFLSLHVVVISFVMWVPPTLLIILLGNLGALDSISKSLLHSSISFSLLFSLFSFVFTGFYLLIKSIIAEKAFNSKSDEENIKAPLIAKPAVSGFVLMIALSAIAAIQVLM